MLIDVIQDIGEDVMLMSVGNEMECDNDNTKQKKTNKELLVSCSRFFPGSHLGEERNEHTHQIVSNIGS
jgi:hypothetical protein